MCDFFSTDNDVKTLFLSSKDIVNNLNKDQVRKVVMSLGADRYEETDKAFIFPTICHNIYPEEASMKLYYYFDRRLFVCYTDCGETFNIFTLVEKVKKLHGEKNFGYNQAKDYIISFLNLEEITVSVDPYVSVTERYRRHITSQQLPEYSDNVMSMFLDIPYSGWLRDGMSREAIAQFGIKYSVSKNAVVIPHYDIDHRLVGIRVRNLDYVKGKDMPKYCPLIVEKNKLYNHPLLMNLYGLDQTKDAIRRSRTAVVFESEKSVILGQTFYGNNNNFVAVCGSNLSKPQVDLLVKRCGVREIVIAFDKEYVDYDSDKATEYFNKLYDIASQYTNYVNMSFLFDYNNLLNEKDSPIDRGKETFEVLMNNKVEVRN